MPVRHQVGSLHSEGTRFESWLGLWPSRLRFFVVFSVALSKYLDGFVPRFGRGHSFHILSNSSFFLPSKVSPKTEYITRKPRRSMFQLVRSAWIFELVPRKRSLASLSSLCSAVFESVCRADRCDSSY
jgi:hypothetical protein